MSSNFFISNLEGENFFTFFLGALKKNPRKIHLVVSYIKKSAINMIKDSIVNFLDNGGKINIITCFDFFLTESKALEILLEFKKEYHEQVKVKIFIEERKNVNFHPKLYLFEGKSSKVIIGSGNMSYSAFTSNVEAFIVSKEKNILDKAKKFIRIIASRSIELDYFLLQLYRENEKNHERVLKTINQKAIKIQKNLEYNKITRLSFAKRKIRKIEKTEHVEKEGIALWYDTTPKDVYVILTHYSEYRDYDDIKSLIRALVSKNKLEIRKQDPWIASRYYNDFLVDLLLFRDEKITELGKKVIESIGQKENRTQDIIAWLFLVTGNGFMFLKDLKIAYDLLKKEYSMKEIKLWSKDYWVKKIMEKFQKKKKIYKKKTLIVYILDLFFKFGISDLFKEKWEPDLDKALDFILDDKWDILYPLLPKKSK